MSTSVALGLAIALLFPILATGLPIAFSILFASLSYLLITEADLGGVGSTMFWFLNKSELAAIPFFILAADILSRSRATDALVEAADALVGHLRGGLALVAMVSTIVFSAISGSSVATAVAVGRVLIPKMIEAGYRRDFTVGLIAAAGGLGILIPPSVPLIIYATIAEISVADTFMAAFGPGLMLGVVLCAYVVYVGDRARDRPRVGPAFVSSDGRIGALKRALPVLALPLLILGGIYGGVFTPNESAAVAVIYAAVIALGVYRTPGKALYAATAASARMAAAILLIMTATAVLSYIIALNRIPLHVRELITDLGLGPIGFLLCVNLLLFVLGCFLEIISVILITVPIFLPVLRDLGIDPIHFAIIVTINMELGVITPPVGMNLFAISAISQTPVATVFRGTLPFMGLIVLVLLVITYCEPAALWTLQLARGSF